MEGSRRCLRWTKVTFGKLSYFLLLIESANKINHKSVLGILVKLFEILACIFQIRSLQIRDLNLRWCVKNKVSIRLFFS